jgi:hypothetical protein
MVLIGSSLVDLIVTGRKNLYNHGMMCRRSRTRRDWLASLAGVTPLSLALSAQTSSPAAASLAMPGRFRGRVAEVRHEGSIVSNAYQSAAIRPMMHRGMMELTGAPDWQSAWRMFFSRGDVVGVKVNPVGRPHVISDATVMKEILEGLAAAGVPAKDVIIYDRYHAELMEGGFRNWAPAETRMMWAAQRYDNVQQNIAGYDRDQYMDMPLTLPGYRYDNVTARRSHVAEFLTKHVSKLINLCVLKDHQSAGVTLALKNLSHGLVNNVNRSHSTHSLNTCGAFIPAVVQLPVIREKAVLHILDGVKGVYHGGPSAKARFVYEHKTIYFATDPVAMDRIGWIALDQQRARMGMKNLAEDYTDRTFSNYIRRQPEHVEIAGAMGLGEWELNKIDHRRSDISARF